MQRLSLIASHVSASARIATSSRIDGGSGEPECVATMRQELAKCQVNAELMQSILLSEEQLTLRKQAYSIILSDPVFARGLVEYEYSIEEHRVACTEKMIRFTELIALYPQLESFFIECCELIDPAFSIRWFVQRGLWIGTLKAHATQEQLDMFLPGSEQWITRGCFCMTELGHSSHLRGSETTATFIPETDEIELNSESILATKWWIGQAGQGATHGIVFANLYSGGKSHGIQLVVCPLRDPSSGTPFPGVEIGDLGPKTGRHGNDNGYIRFNRVRVPRVNMLGKFAQLDRSGAFSAPPMAALAYSSTILERVGSVKGAAGYTSVSLTIAIRYGLVRRQGPGRDSQGREQQIIDYQTHQLLLMPHLAMTYATYFVAERLRQGYEVMLEELDGGNFSSILEMHAASCGLKAFSGWWCTEVLEACRRALGGHGYHAYSGIPARINDFGVVTTGGGDNVVIAQQLARYLVKQLPVDDASFFAYLNNADELVTHVASPADFTDNEQMVRLFQSISARCVQTVARKVKRGDKSRYQVELVEAAEAHTLAFTLESFLFKIRSAAAAQRQHLEVLFKLVCVQSALKHVEWLSLAGFPISDLPQLKTELLDLCQQVRHLCVGLVDAFGFPDAVLRSPLGRRDGDIYTHYLDAVRSARINKTGVAPYWNILPHK